NLRPCATMTLFCFALTSVLPTAFGQDDDRDSADQKTTTPIKHVIVIIGENRTFDNIYATYVPKHGTVSNLLSRGIIHADGSPGPHADLAKQFQLQTINPVSYFIDTRKLINPGKSAYSPFLPTPEVGGVPPTAVRLSQFLKDPADSLAPFDAATFSQSLLHQLSPVLEAEGRTELTTGATALNTCTPDPTPPPFACAEPDTRIANFSTLANTVFQITGSKVPYDSYTGDMVHRFFHMWQQSDCSILDATPEN